MTGSGARDDAQLDDELGVVDLRSFGQVVSTFGAETWRGLRLLGRILR